MRAPLVVLLVGWLIPAVLGALAPAGSSPTPARGATPPDTHAYESGGRHDPFVNLIGTGTESRTAPPKAADGAAGLKVNEISVRGVMQSRGGLIVMVQGADKKTYLVHPGDKFADGTVKSVNAHGLVIVQEVNDPLSLVKQREIRRELRSAEGAKP